MRRIARLVIALGLAAAGGAAPACALSQDPAGVPKATYRLDPGHTSVVMRVSHMGFSRYTLRFDKIEGKLDFDPDHREDARVEIAIDPRSIDSGARALDSQIAGRGFFDVERYPEISFVSRRLVERGEGAADLEGELTFHGVTAPVVLAVMFNGYGGDVIGRTTLGFSATGRIRRSEYGLKAWPGLVGDDVDLVIEAEFKKDGLLTRLLP